MEHSYNLALPGPLSVCVKHTREVFATEKARLLLAAYLPGVRFLLEAPKKSDVIIACRESHEKSLSSRGNRIWLSDSWHGDGSLLDLINLIYSAVRGLWLKMDLYSVHSACVSDPAVLGGFILFVGHSGVGKTSIALALAGTGEKVFSANKTLLSVSADGCVTAIAGTPTITKRTQELESTLVGKTETVAYQGRSAGMLEGKRYAGTSPVRISRIVLARLNDGAHDVQRLEGLSALHKLYPYFLDTVNSDTVLLGGEDVFAGRTPPGCQKRLSANLHLALGKVPVLSLTGSMHYVDEMLLHSSYARV